MSLHARQEWFRKRLMDRGGFLAGLRFAAERAEAITSSSVPKELLLPAVEFALCDNNDWMCLLGGGSIFAYPYSPDLHSSGNYYYFIMGEKISCLPVFAGVYARCNLVCLPYNDEALITPEPSKGWTLEYSLDIFRIGLDHES